MPRAFLITNRRYNSGGDYENSNTIRDASPERSVCTAEGSDDSNPISEGEIPLKPASPHSPASLSRDVQYSFILSESLSPYFFYSQVEPLGLTVTRSPNDDKSNLQISENDSFQRATQDYNFSSKDYQMHSSLNYATNISVIQHVRNLETPSPSSSSSSQSESTDPLALIVENYECPECGKKYSTSSNLARHRQTHRSVTDKKARKCPHCDKVYVSMPAYSMHVRTHSQGCQCPYCGKCFSRPWLLQGHIRTHTGEKPFKCPVCAKAFADKSNLRAHIQTHSVTKPYVCQRCGKAFALKSYLYKHEESSCMRLHRQLRTVPRTHPNVLIVGSTKGEVHPLSMQIQV